MTYQEECRLRAKMLLDAADGVEFQVDFDRDGNWQDIETPMFQLCVEQYRCKPKIVRIESVLLWYRHGDGDICVDVFDTEVDIELFLERFPNNKELKREIVFVEVET